MGILSTFKSAWKAASTTEKVEMVLDVVLGFGASAIGSQVTKKLAPNMNRVERICAGITTAGLGMAAANAAKTAYKPYTEAIGKIIDAAKKVKDKEDDGDGKYTRY